MDQHKYIVTITPKDLEELLRPKFGSFIKVEEVNVIPLTKPGDNFGSTMLAVDVVLVPGGMKLSMVAKLLPDSDFAREAFNVNISVRKEIDMYVLVSPEFKRIEQEYGVPLNKRLDVFCECYGARATRGEDVGQTVNESAALLLENLKVEGYRTGDRKLGLDLKHTELTLDKLARFHATAIAIKIKKPLVFRNTILKACKYITWGAGSKEDAVRDKSRLASEYREIPEFNEHFEKILEIFLQDVENTFSNISPVAVEPFATLVHNDFWTNNMMFRYKSKDDSVPTSMKFVDFQITFYGSPVSDIIFFLFTSTQYGIAEDHMDHLLHIYHDSFINTLSLLGCDTHAFSFDNFLKEIKSNALKGFSKMLSMLLVLTTDHEELDENSDEAPRIRSKKFALNEESKRKIAQVIRVYVNNGWL